MRISTHKKSGSPAVRRSLSKPQKATFGMVPVALCPHLTVDLPFSSFSKYLSEKNVLKRSGDEDAYLPVSPVFAALQTYPSPGNHFYQGHISKNTNTE